MNPLNDIDDRDFGLQPIDALMTQLNVTNAALVHASTEQVSFKMVQKARRGRRLSVKVQMKVLRALQTVVPARKFALGELFNY